MNWLFISDENQLQDIIAQSFVCPIVLYKHSTRCSLSSVVLSRLEREKAPDGPQYYFLDILKNRNISDKVSTQFHVHHESPQILIIRNGECVFDESHMSITMNEIREEVEKLM